MTREPADAWRHLPPFSTSLQPLLDLAVPAQGPPPRGDGVPIRIDVKGTRVSVAIGSGGEVSRHEFRYRRSAGAWQLYDRGVSGWTAVGRPHRYWGELLEAFMLVLFGEAPISLLEEMIRARAAGLPE